MVVQQAMEPHLPKEILYRPKMGFAVPLASWLRGPLRQRARDAVLGDSLAETGLFDPRYLRQLFDQHQSGQSRPQRPALVIADVRCVHSANGCDSSVGETTTLRITRDLGVSVSKWP